MKICAVIPAAGRGSRLNISLPKLLVSVDEKFTVWDILRSKLAPVVQHIHVVASSQGLQLMQKTMHVDIASNLVSLSEQKTPKGMGDAVFTGYSHWSKATTVLILWGDQVNISTNTLKKAIDLHQGQNQTIVLPLAQPENAYVEYVFREKQLIHIQQAREGDVCAPSALSDVGCFVLSTTNLLTLWEQYLISDANVYGAITKEINFLPFLVFLANQGWQVKPFFVANALESRGINTPQDLAFFKQIWQKQSVLPLSKQEEI